MLISFAKSAITARVMIELSCCMFLKKVELKFMKNST